MLIRAACENGSKCSGHRTLMRLKFFMKRRYQCSWLALTSGSGRSTAASKPFSAVNEIQHGIRRVILMRQPEQVGRHLIQFGVHEDIFCSFYPGEWPK